MFVSLTQYLRFGGKQICKGLSRVALIIARLIVMIYENLLDKVRIGSLGKLLESHVDVGVHHFEVFVLLACKEAIVSALVLDTVLRSLTKLLVNG